MKKFFKINIISKKNVSPYSSLNLIENLKPSGSLKDYLEKNWKQALKNILS